MWLLLAVMKVCLPTYKLPLSQRWNFSTWLKCPMVTVSWFSVSNLEWDHRQWKALAVILFCLWREAQGMASAFWIRLWLLWVPSFVSALTGSEGAFGKDFQNQVNLAHEAWGHQPAPTLHGVGRNFTGFFASNIPIWDCAITTHQCAGFSLWCFKFLQPTKNKSSQPSGHQKNTTVNKQYCLKLTQKHHLWSKRCLAHLDTF